MLLPFWRYQTPLDLDKKIIGCQATVTLAKKNAETLTPLALSLQNMGRSAPKMGKQAMPVIKPKAEWDKLIFLRWKGI